MSKKYRRLTSRNLEIASIICLGIISIVYLFWQHGKNQLLYLFLIILVTLTIVIEIIALLFVIKEKANGYKHAKKEKQVEELKSTYQQKSANKDKKNEIRDYLPLGSVVKVKDYTADVIIIKRAINSDGIYYDYAGVVYPIGIIGASKELEFQDTDIERLLFKGYVNEAELKYQKEMKAGLEAKVKNGELHFNKNGDLMLPGEEEKLRKEGLQNVGKAFLKSLF